MLKISMMLPYMGCWSFILLSLHSVYADDTGGTTSGSGDIVPKNVGDFDGGAIAGLAVGGVIAIVSLILLAVYCCVRAKRNEAKNQDYADRNDYSGSNVYTSGTSQAIFPSGSMRHPKGKYGSMEDIKSSASSQDRNNGAYTNPGYTKEPSERQSERHASVGRYRGKAGFTNDGYDGDDSGPIEQSENSWDERETTDNNRNKRISRRDASERGGNQKPMKSAMKKNPDFEMGQVAGSHTVNGILKSRAHSPNRSQASSTDASLDAKALIYGYKEAGKDLPNVKHQPVIERRRSRSGTRSHRSGSSGGRSRRSKSPDKKITTSRMYGEVFIDDRRSSRSRSSGRRARSESSKRSRSDRTSESVDSGSSTASQSRKVSMNPGGKRVHIKGEETDI